MKKEGKIICDFMHDFTENNWEKINKKKCEIKKTKEKFLEEVKTNTQTALWVLTEVCQWGMDKVYLKELYVVLSDENDFNVIKIKDKYIKLKWVCPIYEINFCKPKRKTVMYYFD